MSRCVSSLRSVADALSTSTLAPMQGDKAKNFTDCTDLRFTAPALEFHNKTWSFEELIHEIKRQVLKSAWDQKGHLVSQFFNKRPKQANRSQPPPKLLGGAMSSSRLASPASHSSLRILINPATAPTTPSGGSATPGFTKLLPVSVTASDCLLPLAAQLARLRVERTCSLT